MPLPVGETFDPANKIGGINSAVQQPTVLFSDHPYDAFLAKPYTLDELRRVLGHRKEAS